MTRTAVDALFWVPVVVYISSNFFFSAYLKKHHNEVWQSLGSLSFSNWGVRNANRFGGYLLFRSAYKELKDSKATRYVMVIRLLVIVAFTPVTLFTLLLISTRSGLL